MERKKVFSELVENIENACIQARRVDLRAGRVRFYLKTQEFRYGGLELELNVPTSTPIEMIKLVKESFDKVYKKGVLYRATGFCLYSLVPKGASPVDLFGESSKVEKSLEIFKAVDRIGRKYGQDTIYLGGSRGKKNETPQKHLELPFLGVAR